MKLLKGLFKSKAQEQQSVDELNEVFVPIRDAILDFKDDTKISWTVILPATHMMSARLRVRSIGLQSTRQIYDELVRDRNQSQKIPVSSIVEVRIPSYPPEQLAQVNILLWKIANNLIAKGFPVENVARAFTAFANMVAAKAVDELYVTMLLRETYKELQSEKFS